MKDKKILINFLLYIFVLFVICIVGISNVFALETKTIYSDSSLSNSNKYLYGMLNSGGTEYISTGSVGTRINGKAIGFTFYFSASINANYTYKIRVNFYSDDLVPNFSSDMVTISTCDNTSCSPVTLVGISKQNSSGYSTYVDLSFNPVLIANKIKVVFGNSNRDYITGETFFGINSVQIEGTNKNEDIMNNANQNANNIINNNNNNSQNIIDNQNQNTEKEIESQKVCSFIDKSSIVSNGYLYGNGVVISSDLWGITDYLNIQNGSIKVNEVYTGGLLCYYNINKDLISCVSNVDLQSGEILNLPVGSKYVRFSINKNANKPQFTICQDGNQALNDSINGLNDNLNDDDSSGATSEASDFFSSFNTNTFGLTSIITAPLNLIESLTSSSCSELELPLPFLNNKKLKLPCMTTIYQNTFGSLFTMYQTITFGIIAYWVCVRIFNQVKDFKNPEHDEIEVIDL